MVRAAEGDGGAQRITGIYVIAERFVATMPTRRRDRPDAPAPVRNINEIEVERLTVGQRATL
jgi:hypothetical protein